MKSRSKALKPQNLLCLAACLLLLVMGLGAAFAQEGKSSSAPRVVKFNFDQDTVGQTPAGFTSYATGGGPAGKWVVQEMADAPSGKQVVVQTDADATDNRFPVLIADKEDYADVDVSLKGKAISARGTRGSGWCSGSATPRATTSSGPTPWKITSGSTRWWTAAGNNLPEPR